MDFRTSFGRLAELRTHFDAPVVALSATLTENMCKLIPKQLGLSRPKKIQLNPDRPNIKLEVKKKPTTNDITVTMEAVYKPELERLQQEDHEYPVTLCYMPLEWCSNAQMEAISLFGKPNLETSNYAIFFCFPSQLC